jgi:hypothetical protein
MSEFECVKRKERPFSQMWVVKWPPEVGIEREAVPEIG